MPATWVLVSAVGVLALEQDGQQGRLQGGHVGALDLERRDRGIRLGGRAHVGDGHAHVIHGLADGRQGRRELGRHRAALHEIVARHRLDGHVRAADLGRHQRLEFRGALEGLLRGDGLLGGQRHRGEPAKGQLGEPCHGRLLVDTISGCTDELQVEHVVGSDRRVQQGAHGVREVQAPARRRSGGRRRMERAMRSTPCTSPTAWFRCRRSAGSYTGTRSCRPHSRRRTRSPWPRP